MKINKYIYALCLLSVELANANSVQNTVNLQNFAKTFQNDLLSKSAQKIMKYTRCSKNHPTCIAEIEQSIKYLCSDDIKHVKENGSICNLLKIKTIDIDVRVIKNRKLPLESYLITFYDSSKMKNPSKETQKQIIKAAKNWNGMAEIIVFSDETGSFKIDPYLIETSSIWIEQKH